MSKISHPKVIDESRYQMLLAVARRLARMEPLNARFDFERKLLFRSGHKKPCMREKADDTGESCMLGCCSNFKAGRLITLVKSS